MKRCQNCGTDIEENVKICPICSSEIDEEYVDLYSVYKEAVEKQMNKEERSSLIMVRRPAADCPPMHTTPDTTMLRFGFCVESDMRLLSRDEGCCVGQ